MELPHFKHINLLCLFSIRMNCGKGIIKKIFEKEEREITTSKP